MMIQHLEMMRLSWGRWFPLRHCIHFKSAKMPIF